MNDSLPGQIDVEVLRLDLRGRRSRFAWRRRRAYRACLSLIEYLEADIAELTKTIRDALEAAAKPYLVAVGDPADLCLRCGIARRFAGYTAESCGTEMYFDGCFVLPRGFRGTTRFGA